MELSGRFIAWGFFDVIFVGLLVLYSRILRIFSRTSTTYQYAPSLKRGLSKNLGKVFSLIFRKKILKDSNAFGMAFKIKFKKMAMTIVLDL